MAQALTHWLVSWPVLAGYALVAAAHLRGLRRTLAAAPGRDARRELIREAALCQLGLAAALLALISPVGYWSGVYLWVRAVQDLLLAFIAPGLIVLGAPWAALRQALAAGPAGLADDRPGDGADRPARVSWLLARPLPVVVAFNLVWLGWHLPAAFDLAHASGAAALAERACYLVAGIAFWLQIIGSRPLRPAASPLRRAALLTGTVLAGTVLGMVLVFGSGVLYPAYGATGHQVMTVLDDQQLSGAVLWMGMLPPLIIAATALLLRWLNEEESADLSVGLDRLLARRGSAWPSRAGLR